MKVSLIPNVAILAGVAACLAFSGQAEAGGRSHHRHNDCGRPSFRVGFGFSNCGSGISVGFGSGFRSYDCGIRSSYCPPRYCPPVVVSRPYCAPSSHLYTYSSPIIVSRPVITQPVVVQQPVVIQPQYVQPQVVQEPVTIQAATTGVPAQSQPPAQSTQEPEQGRYQDRDLGDAYLRMNDPENAVRVYKRYLSVWNGDGTVTRNLGFALIDRGDVQEGFRSVVRGYTLEKDLVQRPIRMSDLGGKIGFERLLDAATRGAAGTNTAEGWLTVAILQHAAGQSDAAVTAFEKAKQAGLDQSTIDLFAAELGKPAE